MPYRKLLHGKVAGVDPATAALARRSRQVVEALKPKETGDMLRLAQSFPIWLRRHGLLMALRGLRQQGGQLAKGYEDRVLKKLDLHHPLDLTKYETTPVTVSAATLVADSAEALRRADVFCTVAKALLDDAVSTGATL
jgi:hypothetical protein